jgi:mercuric ion transport protein
MRERARVISAAGGAFGLSGFAAAIGLCCTVPWAVTLLGVTGAVAFARLTFLLPYSVVGAAGLLSLAFWLAYRRPADCADNSCTPRNRQALQWFVWITAALVVALSLVAFTMRVTL